MIHKFKASDDFEIKVAVPLSKANEALVVLLSFSFLTLFVFALVRMSGIFN